MLVLYAFVAVFGGLALGLHSPATGPRLEKLFLVAGMVGSVATVLALVTWLTMRRVRPSGDDADSMLRRGRSRG